MGFIQTISYRTTRPDEIQALAEKFNRDNPDAPGLIGTKVLKDRDRENSYLIIAEFANVPAGRASSHREVELGDAFLHRLDLELALARVLQILGRPEEHVDDRTEERRHEADQRRNADEPGICDPPSCVLERPVRGREPEEHEHDERGVLRERPAL